MTCTACGDCCKEVPLSLPLDADKALWFGLRGWDVAALSEDRMEVVAPAVCRSYEPAADHHCRIYENRPQFCREYLCPEAKETP
jgi:Fe-S-cluster containining protein